jgi:hypothetical protein
MLDMDGNICILIVVLKDDLQRNLLHVTQKHLDRIIYIVHPVVLKTNSKLTIKFFVDDRSTHLESSIEYDPSYILNDDITQGKECVKISVYNDNDSNLPESFIYGTETRSKLIFPNDTTTTMTCCSCTDK